MIRKLSIVNFQYKSFILHSDIKDTENSKYSKWHRV